MGRRVLIERVVLSYIKKSIPHSRPLKKKNYEIAWHRQSQRGGREGIESAAGRGPPDPFWSTGQRRRQHLDLSSLLSLSHTHWSVSLSLALRTTIRRRGCFIGTSLAPRMHKAAVGFRSRARNVVRHAALPADPVVHPQTPPPRQFPPGQG
jgi:hypothetical protein